MADARDLHQIEYRHHQTKDLSPVASSMSTESLRAWDSRIRMWVRHPHADRLSESLCYQVLAAGQAALALRYWDQRAAERTDGSRGRPLVSRVLVGQASVLTPEVAVALCRTGLTAGSVGPMPGEVPEGAGLPTVSGDALSAVANAMIPTLDEDAARQPGLQAVVAAALCDPLAPLAISVPDAVIQEPLREGVQYPLLWGLRRITGPLHGPVGRAWSFSTFEPPLGETDPASLPSIVFRQTQAGAQTPPARWRKEVNVRPLAPDALGPGPAYAAWVEMAGWLVTEYQERGGEGLAQFVANCCGNERSLPMRVERIFHELRRAESPVIVSDGPTGYISLPADRARAHEEAKSAAAAESEQSDPAEPGISDPEESEIADRAGSGITDREEFKPDAAGNEDGQAEWLESRTAEEAAREPVPASAGSLAGGAEDAVYQEHQEPRPGGFQSPTAANEWAKSLAPSRAGQTPPPLPVQVRGGPQPGSQDPARQGGWFESPSPSVSYLLKQLELVGNDAEQCDSILRRIPQIGRQPDDPNDRVKSWEVISDHNWYDNISKNYTFHPDTLATILGLVVIPDLDEPDAAETIARWAVKAQPAMIGGLLAAAQQAGADNWQSVMRILEPVLAARWADQHLTAGQWDAHRARGTAAELGRGDGKRTMWGRRRKH